MVKAGESTLHREGEVTSSIFLVSKDVWDNLPEIYVRKALFGPPNPRTSLQTWLFATLLRKLEKAVAVRNSLLEKFSGKF